MQTDLAEAALIQYNLVGAQLTFLGQSQNTTFRVDASTGEQFLLRLHAGIDSSGGNAQIEEPVAIRSELLWLNAIAQDMGLVVPQPVQNRLGEWVTRLDASWEPISASLLRWVEGKHLDREPTVAQVRQLGQLMAQLHQHSCTWVLPAGFVRPSHDGAQLEAATGQLEVLVQSGTISRDDYQVFQQAAAQVQALMPSLPQTPETWGLIHADLHQGNYLFWGEEIRPIDFSRCGFGFYLYDIGQTLGDVEPALRPYFFEGYANIQTLPTDYRSLVEAFFVGATVENFAFHSTNPKEQEWLARAVPYVVKHHLHSYLEGKTFLDLA